MIIASTPRASQRLQASPNGKGYSGLRSHADRRRDIILFMSQIERSRTGPFKLPAPLTFILLPFFLLAGVLSIPFARFSRRRFAQFVARMKSEGRFLEWDACVQELKSGHGTAIIEYVPGLCLIWWTSDELSDPENSHHEFNLDCPKEPDCDFCARMRRDYTTSAGGRAILVGDCHGNLTQKLESLVKGPHISIRGSLTERRADLRVNQQPRVPAMPVH